MTEYEIGTALSNWLGDGEITDIESDLDDFMSNVIDASDKGEMSEKQRQRIEDFARDWMESRIATDA
jgi:hypothetical protein